MAQKSVETFSFKDLLLAIVGWYTPASQEKQRAEQLAEDVEQTGFADGLKGSSFLNDCRRAVADTFSIKTQDGHGSSLTWRDFGLGFIGWPVDSNIIKKSIYFIFFKWLTRPIFNLIYSVAILPFYLLEVSCHHFADWLSQRSPVISWLSYVVKGLEWFCSGVKFIGWALFDIKKNWVRACRIKTTWKRRLAKGGVIIASVLMWSAVAIFALPFLLPVVKGALASKLPFLLKLFSAYQSFFPASPSAGLNWLMNFAKWTIVAVVGLQLPRIVKKVVVPLWNTLKRWFTNRKVSPSNAQAGEKSPLLLCQSDHVDSSDRKMSKILQSPSVVDHSASSRTRKKNGETHLNGGSNSSFFHPTGAGQSSNSSLVSRPKTSIITG